MSNKLKIKILSVALWFFPAISFAQAKDSRTLKDVIEMFINWGLLIIPLLGAVAFLAFILGIGRFIRASSGSGDLDKSKRLVIWGVVGMFVLMSVWGIVSFIKNEFGFGGSIPIPQLPTMFGGSGGNAYGDNGVIVNSDIMFFNEDGNLVPSNP